MKVLKIIAGVENIVIELEKNAEGFIDVCASVALTCGVKEIEFTPGRAIWSQTCKIEKGCVTIPRYAEDYDLLICRFTVRHEGQLLNGVRFVTDFSEGFSKYNYDYPMINRPVGTWVTAEPEDIDELRFGYMMSELNQAWFLTLAPKEDDYAHVWNGNTYYIQRKMVEEVDDYMSRAAVRKLPCLIRFINRYKYRLRGSDDRLASIIQHPGYESDFDGVEMSAVNLRTEDGLNHYCACLDFIFDRYSNPENPYCWSIMTDIGNEVNSQQIWHNAGPMTCEAFMEEYSVALRLAWLLSRKYYAHHRINISLEQNFAVPFVNDPMHYYSNKECLEWLAYYCHRDGDFDWGVAAHPYPENLNYPDFYNDRSALFSLDTPKITLKNMEVWPAYLSQKQFLYRGQIRHIVFDEQGFNTRDDAPYTEKQGAYGFVLAYLKLRKSPYIDLILLHRYSDIPNGEEYGLNLGLRRSLGYADDEHLKQILGPHKMICDAIRAMDTDEEELWIKAARDYIGAELFDDVLNPPMVKVEERKQTITNFEI